jgi:hypothetical protein
MNKRTKAILEANKQRVKTQINKALDSDPRKAIRFYGLNINEVQIINKTYNNIKVKEKSTGKVRWWT